MVDLRELEGTKKGQTALVLGGGPSLPEQYANAPDGFKFSVNQHGCILTTCDAIVMLDRKPILHCRSFNIPIYHPRNDCADIRLTHFWNAGNSAMTAVWVADFMGFNRIVLMGIDCYSGGTYFWDEDYESAGNHANPDMHLNSWRRVKKNVCHWSKIRVMGGPLVELFPLYDPDEVMPIKLQETEPMTAKTNTIYIHALANTRCGNISVEAGGCYWVLKKQAAILVEKGKAEYAEPPKVTVKPAKKKAKRGR